MGKIIPKKPLIHRSHQMQDIGLGGRNCSACGRCTCHRLPSLGFMCPEREMEIRLENKENE